MLPVIALVGRPNVGKSTLFNALTGTRDALVADLPGLTRDRKYGYTKSDYLPCILVDTGGLTPGADGVEKLMAEQSLRAMAEADRVLFVVDGRQGCTTVDHFVSQLIRVCDPDPSSLSQRPEMLERRIRFLIVRLPSCNGVKITSVPIGPPIRGGVRRFVSQFGSAEFLTDGREEVRKVRRPTGREFGHLGIAQAAIAFKPAFRKPLIQR